MMRTAKYLVVDSALDDVPDAAPEIDKEIATPADLASALLDVTGLPHSAEVYVQTCRADGSQRWQPLNNVSQLPEGVIKAKLVRPKAGPAAAGPAAAGTAADIKAAIMEALEQSGLIKTVAQSKSFSKVSASAAAEIYRLAGLSIEDGLQTALIDEAFEDCGWFDMSEYPNEAAATGPFLQHIKECLAKQGVLMGRDGFQVVDIHKQQIYELQIGGIMYRGGLDGAVLPFGVAAMYPAAQLRCGIEVKHSQKHKALYKEKHERVPSQGTEEGISFDGTIRGQALVETLAAAVFAEVPDMLLLQSSFDYNTVLQLSGRVVTVWFDITFGAAMCLVSKFLKECSTDRRFMFSKYKESLKPEVVEPIEQLRKKLRPDSLLLEQLDSLTAGEDSSTKFAVALELLHAHRPCGPAPLGMFG